MDLISERSVDVRRESRTCSCRSFRGHKLLQGLGGEAHQSYEPVASSTSVQHRTCCGHGTGIPAVRTKVIVLKAFRQMEDLRQTETEEVVAITDSNAVVAVYYAEMH